MTDRRRIQDFVVRIQEAFLDTPALRLTVQQAQRRFGVSPALCQAVLNLLVEAGVLRRTAQGQHVRLIPRSTGRAAA